MLPDVDADVFDKYVNSALDLVSQVLCFNPAYHTDSCDGVVEANGMSVSLPFWASAITKVEYEGSELDFTFAPYRAELVDGQLVSYNHELTISGDVLTPGTLVQVSGDIGFKQPPSQILRMLESAIKTLSEYGSGDYRVTSKSIEDVSVSMSDLESPVDFLKRVYAGSIYGWSLCSAYRNPHGSIATDAQLPDKPWWVTDDDAGVVGV